MEQTPFVGLKLTAGTKSSCCPRRPALGVGYVLNACPAAPGLRAGVVCVCVKMCTSYDTDENRRGFLKKERKVDTFLLGSLSGFSPLTVPISCLSFLSPPASLARAGCRAVWCPRRLVYVRTSDHLRPVTTANHFDSTVCWGLNVFSLSFLSLALSFCLFLHPAHLNSLSTISLNYCQGKRHEDLGSPLLECLIIRHFTLTVPPSLDL